MGVWDATCLVSNLAIPAGASIRLIFLERKPGADFQYASPNSAWQVIGLPVRGEYNEYGGITQVDNASPQAHLLLNLAKRLFGQEQAQEFTSVELLAECIWERPRFLYHLSPTSNGLECWPDATTFDHDASGKYGPVYASGRDKSGNLLAGYRLREFGYALILEEVYQAMLVAAQKTYRLKVRRIYEETKVAIFARRELLAPGSPSVPIPATALVAVAEAQVQTPTCSPGEQAERLVKLAAYQEQYANWRRNYIPNFFDGFSELETLLLAESEAESGTVPLNQVKQEQASLGYALAQFQVFNEAMAISRRHYSPQSCGEQHGWLQEYRFHQLLSKQIMRILDERISEIEAAEAAEAAEKEAESNGNENENE